MLQGNVPGVGRGARRQKEVAQPRYPPIADYGLIGDCHSAALVHKSGSIDWCCMPRFDSGSCFGRLLDWDRGGYCSITPVEPGFVPSRRYVPDTMVLETTFRTGGGEARLFDCFTMRRGGARNPYQQLLRVVEGVRGRLDLRLDLQPRFDYAEVRPWIRQLGVRYFSAIGGNDGLLVSCDADIAPGAQHDLGATLFVRAGERVHVSIQAMPPELIDQNAPEPPDSEELDRRLAETLAWWKRWSGKGKLEGAFEEGAKRSAFVLKALTNAPTGAIAAAPTTSLPESPKGGRNWDYRFSWIRDSSYAVRSLAELGYDAEADGFRRFAERSAAGNAEDLQIVYGLGGERRLTELVIENMEGYRGAKPVRAGNAAARQVQLDVYGELLELAWRWHRRGHSPDDDYWRFLVELVNAAAKRWTEPDRGIWEIRGTPRHFVFSKVLCWVALDRGIALAQECERRAPLARWRKVRTEMRRAVETKGYDERRGVFVQAFGSKALDGALLLLPAVGFVEWEDERMIRTADQIKKRLDDGGLVKRYRGSDGLEGEEGAFLPCSFWLVECLARQDRYEEAREVFDRAVSTGNDLGLFSEEFDVRSEEMLGNFPMGLTHLSHIAACIALARH
jgi:GH15 family glucan-1,4-alpha-glucosidase